MHSYTLTQTHLDALGSRLSLISHTALQPVLSFCTQRVKEMWVWPIWEYYFFSIEKWRIINLSLWRIIDMFFTSHIKSFTCFHHTSFWFVDIISSAGYLRPCVMFRLERCPQKTVISFLSCSLSFACSLHLSSLMHAYAAVYTLKQKLPARMSAVF